MQTIKQWTRQLRRGILALYAGILIVLCGGMAYSLRQSWLGELKGQTDSLERHASSVSSLVRDSMVDASKILDIAKSRIEAEMDSSFSDRQAAYRIIRSVMENFSIFNNSETLGLLLFLDRNGRLLARSGEYPTPDHDLSDRGYYLDLKKDPSRKVSFGRLRVAKTTGLMVFHLAMPLRDKQGAFAGVVALQISEDDLSSILKHVLSGVSDRIRVLTPSGETAFLFPRPHSLPDPEDPMNTLLLKEVKARGSEKGVVRIGGERVRGPFGETVWVAFMRDPIFGFVSTARVPDSLIRSNYWMRSRNLLAIGLASIVTISALFYGLYRKALSLEKTIREAAFDHMTLIRSRRSMERELQRLWRSSMRGKTPICILFLDVDRFKEFNDLHGHAAGDRVLKAVARVIHRSLHRPLDLCCRWGGEEFLITLPETRAGESLVVAEHIRGAIRKMRLKSNGKDLPQVTVSIGIASSETVTVSTPEELIAMADEALRSAKESGRDRVVTGRPCADSPRPCPESA